jgi:hypothetical protein
VVGVLGIQLRTHHFECYNVVNSSQAPSLTKLGYNILVSVAVFHCIVLGGDGKGTKGEG